MKKIIVLIVSAALLLSAPLAMARGRAALRAKLDRTWKKEQAYQQRIDKKLDKIQREAERDLSREFCTSGQSTWQR